MLLYFINHKRLHFIFKYNLTKIKWKHLRVLLLPYFSGYFSVSLYFILKLLSQFRYLNFLICGIQKYSLTFKEHLNSLHKPSRQGALGAPHNPWMFAIVDMSWDSHMILLQDVPNIFVHTCFSADNVFWYFFCFMCLWKIIFIKIII